MKIRSGFVSNSSSSSFILAFPKEPVSPNEIKQLMFGGETYDFTGDTGRGVFNSNTDQICGIIYGEILKGDVSCKSLDGFLGLIHNLDWYVNEKFYNKKFDFCEMFNNSDKCKSKCPRIKICPDCKNISDDERKKRIVKEDVKRTQDTFEFVKKFVSQTLGYKYYWLDCGCQTAFGAFLNKHHEEVLKNIHHIYVEEEF